MARDIGSWLSGPEPVRPGGDTGYPGERLGLPVFVKPSRGGSSIGVSRVMSADELSPAIAEARRHDPKVIIEAAINGRELECGVLELDRKSTRLNSSHT